MNPISAGKLIVPVLTLAVVLGVLLLSRLAETDSVATSTTLDNAESGKVMVADLTIARVPTVTPTPMPTATPIPSPVRIMIPAIGVDAPVVETGVSPDGAVDAPQGPDEVGWTNGSARPGSGGNAILSGHYDWSLPAPRGAVFYRLSYLQPGDKATILLANGTELVYEVVSSTRYLASNAPAELILGPSSTDIITMITCEGTYYRDIRDYSHRRVVVARRALS